ncbi:uncharacterized protein LOC128221197 [Mya arenaria]|uniref:uncharacterized protein LOC128221197 n=1 Tax=Mya arenaria TaxID=6604 RepID=UPI0022E73D9E|nr:uncharacterized protein LOC128221197 [Mya arenaria]
MELKGFRRSTVTSLLSIAIAVILCVVGTFSNSWWTILKSQRVHETFGLFTTVACKDWLCFVKGESSDSFVAFTQAMSIIELIMLGIAFSTGCLIVIYGSRTLSAVVIAALGIACFASMVQILVLASVYGKISTAMASALTLPSDLLYYQTLPVGICAISGISCIPAAVGMLYWRLVTTGTVRKAAVVV